MNKILITGGAGFIGGHLARHFVARGISVAVLDDLSSGTRANLPDTAQLIIGSVTDIAKVTEAMAGCDAVIHLAALVSVPACVERWQEGHEINLTGTVNVFDAAASVGKIPVIYASSAAVYGDQGVKTLREATLPLPKSPYGADKLACEHQARAFWETKGLPSIGLRFFNVFGPGQSIASPYAGVVARFCDNARNGIAHTVFGDGEQVRDFIYVADLVRVIDALLLDLQRTARADVLNVCTQTPTTLNDLIRAINAVIPGSAEGVSYLDARIGDIRYSQGDDAALKRIIGEADWTTVEQGLADILSSGRG